MKDLYGYSLANKGAHSHSLCPPFCRLVSQLSRFPILSTFPQNKAVSSPGMALLLIRHSWLMMAQPSVLVPAFRSTCPASVVFSFFDALLSSARRHQVHWVERTRLPLDKSRRREECRDRVFWATPAQSRGFGNVHVLGDFAPQSPRPCNQITLAVGCWRFSPLCGSCHPLVTSFFSLVRGRGRDKRQLPDLPVSLMPPGTGIKSGRPIAM